MPVDDTSSARMTACRDSKERHCQQSAAEHYKLLCTAEQTLTKTSTKRHSISRTRASCRTHLDTAQVGQGAEDEALGLLADGEGDLAPGLQYVAVPADGPPEDVFFLWHLPRGRVK